MHELSIAASIVDAVTETVSRYPGARVKEVRLRVGALASVIEDSLQFCWGVSIEGTPLEGSKLVVNILPVIVHCSICGKQGKSAACRAFAADTAVSRQAICVKAANWRLIPSRSTRLRRRYDHQDRGTAAWNSQEE